MWRFTSWAPIFWAAVAGAWLLLLAAYAGSADWTAAPSWQALVLVAVAASTGVLWLNGLRHLAMWAMWAIGRDAAPGPDDGGYLDSRDRADVALLYCTADDFNPAALRVSMGQRHPVTSVILDDSADPGTQRRIDAFARETGATVLRRSGRSGFKAGNLNHGIDALLDRFDYFVVLDSDTVLCADFVDRALVQFRRDRSVGIVQGRNAAAGDTAFASAFAGLLGTHIAVTQAARQRTGFLTFTGRAAMISADCFRTAGRIPEVVSEDLAFSLEVRRAGFGIAYASDLVCTEDYPVDYHAFRTQQAKTVQGTTEFLKACWSRILRSPIPVSEKADLLLDQLLVPLVAIAGLVLIVGGGILGAAGVAPAQPPWVIAVTAVLASAPLLPETGRLVRAGRPIRAIRFFGMASALYASTLLVTLRASVTVLCGGRAVFRITPKKAHPRSGWRTVRALRLELLLAVLAASAAVSGGAGLSLALPFVGSAAAAVCLALLNGAPRPAADAGIPALRRLWGGR